MQLEEPLAMKGEWDSEPQVEDRSDAAGRSLFER